LHQAGGQTIVNGERRPATVEAGRWRFIEPPLPDRMMIEALKEKLGEEVSKLRYELNVTLPSEIRRAVEMGDLKENSEYKAALERQQLVQARLGQLMQRLSKLAQIDITQIPSDKVGLGSKITVEDQDSKEVETYHLIFGDSVEFEDGQVTIGRAMLNKELGDLVLLKLPARTRKMKITALVTMHQQKADDLV
jgi:transcription elongation factor GreA